MLTVAVSFREDLIKDKDGITVKSDFDTDGGKIQVPVSCNQRKTVEIEVTNEGTDAVKFVRCEMLRRFRVFTLNDEKKVTNSQPLQLHAGEMHLSFPSAHFHTVFYSFLGYSAWFSSIDPSLNKCCGQLSWEEFGV